MRPASALFRRAFADGRIRTASFGLLFAIVGYASAVGYREIYKTRQESLELERTFGSNKAVELFYGSPHNLLSAGGFTAWRLAGFGSIIAGVWAVFAAVRALRAEEDTGRQELVLAGTISRTGAYLASLSAVAAGAAVLWLVAFVGLIAARLPVAGSAYLALATISPIPFFNGVGALTSQLASTRRLALEAASGVLALAFLLRTIVDLANHSTWLRWLTPFGWTELLRPFADPRPTLLVPQILGGGLLVLVAGRIARTRDVGSGLLHDRDTRPPRLELLSSTTREALRRQTGTYVAWSIGCVSLALIIGILSTAFTKASVSANLRRTLAKFGDASLSTPAAALGFYFLFFVVALSLFACAQVGAAHHDETGEQLETLLALPLSRPRWLAGRLLLAAGAATILALTIGAVAWVGTEAEHAQISLPRMLEAGANCLPATILFLGAAALLYGVLPRASSACAYGLVVAAFVWELLGALLRAPHWLLESTPFAHIATVPGQAFRPDSAAAMIALGLAGMLAGVVAFDRRDLTGN